MRTFKYTHKIYFADTDQAKVVHHSHYLRFLEAARIEMLAELGYPYKDMQEKCIGLAPVDIHVQYMAPLRLEDSYEVITTVIEVRAASVVVDQVVKCRGERCCQATVKLACLDEAAFKVVRVPEKLRRLMA